MASGDNSSNDSQAIGGLADSVTVHVNLAERSYDILIASDSLNSVAPTAESWYERRFPGKDGQRSALVVTDRNVASHAEKVLGSLKGAGWKAELEPLDPGETTKTLDVISRLYDRLVAMKADRKTAIVAVGGGGIGDSAGFLAATYGRGVPFIQVPTTLLADVDSSVGGKVGVNHPAAKNLIGAFYQPLGVFIDTSVLTTLPERDYLSGMAEVVKYGVILDAEFFDYLEQNVEGLQSRDPAVLRHIIARSCQLKADVVEQDEYERTGLRAVLNYGHTFAHAFEALAGYGELLHGEAVSIGMLYASRLAEKRGLIDADVTARQRTLIDSLNMISSLPSSSDFSADAIIEKMLLDKKTVAGQLRFVLPTRMGHVETFGDVPESDVREVLAELG